MNLCTHGVDLIVGCPECNLGVPTPKPTATVHHFTGITTQTFDPDWILEKAKGRLKQVLVIGYDEEDGSFFFSGSHADGSENLWLLEVAKTKLIKMVEPE